MKQGYAKGRCDSIGIWRFFFAIIIVLYHMSSSTALTYNIFRKGFLAVDFFFLLSGFLLVQTYNKYVTKYNSCIEVIKRKIKKIAPIWYFSLISVFLYRLSFMKNSLEGGAEIRRMDFWYYSRVFYVKWDILCGYACKWSNLVCLYFIYC